MKQPALHPSPLALLPSSHCSPRSMFPSPQTGVASSVQTALQPSPLTLPPSSHSSPVFSSPSPQIPAPRAAMRIGSEVTVSNTPSSSRKMPVTRTRSPASSAVSIKLAPVMPTRSPFPSKPPSRTIGSKPSPGSISDSQVQSTRLSTSPPGLSASVTPAIEAVRVMVACGVPRIVARPSATLLPWPRLFSAVNTIVSSANCSRSTFLTRSRPPVPTKSRTSV